MKNMSKRMVTVFANETDVVVLKLPLANFVAQICYQI